MGAIIAWFVLWIAFFAANAIVVRRPSLWRSFICIGLFAFLGAVAQESGPLIASSPQSMRAFQEGLAKGSGQAPPPPATFWDIAETLWQSTLFWTAITGVGLLANPASVMAHGPFFAAGGVGAAAGCLMALKVSRERKHPWGTP